MSYDLAIFGMENAPQERRAFLDWYSAKTQWNEDVDYSDPGVLDPQVEAFYSHMRGRFPPMNGPFAEDAPEGDEAYVTDYCGAGDFLYLSFSRSIAEEAREAVRDMAINEGLGFFDASATDGELLFPVPEPTRQPGFFKRLFRKQR